MYRDTSSVDCADLTHLPSLVTATRLDQLVYSLNYYIQIFQTNLLPAVRIEPSTCTLEVAKSGALTYYAMGAIWYTHDIWYISCVVMCYHVLWCVIMCCDVLPCVVMGYPVLWCVMMCCDVLSCVVMCYHCGDVLIIIIV